MSSLEMLQGERGINWGHFQGRRMRRADAQPETAAGRCRHCSLRAGPPVLEQFADLCQES